MDYSKETYNYFKLAHIVINLVAKVMRDVFKHEWDKRYPTAPWEDDLKSLNEFANIQSSHGLTDKIGRRNFQDLMKTSGDRKEWDVTILCYTLLYSKPISLKISSTIGGAIDKLRNIRNNCMHIKRTKLSDADFQDNYSKIKNEILKLSPLCKKHLSKLKKIKHDTLPSDIIAELRVSITKEKKKLEYEKFQRRVITVCSLVIIIIMTCIIYLLCTNLIPSAFPSYFPEHHIPGYFQGRTHEIEESTAALISGTRGIVLYGASGIGKKTTSLVIGRNIKSLWRPFPWFCVCYVPLYGIRNVREMELQVLKSFYAERDITYDNIENSFMELMTKKIKRKTLIILDGGTNDKGNDWKYVIDNMLDKNENIYIILTASQPIHFIKYSVKLIHLKPLSSNESIHLIDRIKTGIPNEIKETLTRYSAGSPIFLEMFTHVIKTKHNADDVSGLLLKASPVNACEALLVFLELLNPVEEIFVRFISFFPSKVSLTALKLCSFDLEQVLTSLTLKSVIKQSVGSNERYFTLHESFKSMFVCERDLQHTSLITDIKLNFCFNKHFIDEANAIAQDFLSPASMKIDMLRLFELEENLKIMLENGRSIKDFWQQENIPVRTELLGTDFYNFFVTGELPNKYDGIHVYSLKGIYYKMLYYVSPLLTYDVFSTVFSMHVYYKSAMVLEIDRDFDLMIKMIYSLCEKGDIYFFQHMNKNDASITIIEKNIRMINDEERCEILIDAKDKALCLFVSGRSLALYPQMKIISETVRSLKDVKKGIELIDRSIKYFTALKMDLKVAEAFSTKGLVQYATGHTYVTDKMHYINALNILQNLYKKNPILAASYFNVGFLYYNMGECNILLAIKYFNMSFNMYHSTLGIHRRTAYSAFFLGKALQKVGKYIESMSILSKAYTIQEEVMQKDNVVGETKRYSEELNQMKTLHDNALKSAKSECLKSYPVEYLMHSMSLFEIMKYGNCHRGWGNINHAKQYLNFLRQKMINLSNDSSNYIEILHLLKDDIDDYLGLCERSIEEPWKGHYILLLISIVLFVQLFLPLLVLYRS